MDVALSAALVEHRTASQERLLESLTTDEWSSLAALAIRHRIPGLLVFAAPPAMPAGVRRTLTARWHAASVRVLRHQAEFVRFARAVEPQGIQLLVLKGLHLASSVYPQTVLREMNDIDVLVRPEHLQGAAATAQALGYVAMHEVGVRASRVTHHLPRLVKPGAGLELHWRIAPEGQPPLADPAGLWDRAEPNALAGNAFELCPEDALLHICAHATVSHFFDQGLRPLCDIRALMAKHGGRIDWEVVTVRAAEWRCERGVALALRLTEHLLGVPVPQVLLDRLASALPPSEVAALGADQVYSQHVVQEFSEAAGRLMALRSVPAKIRHAWSYVALPSAQLAAMYPRLPHSDSLGRVVMPLRRLWDMARRYAWTLARLSMNRDSQERQFVDRRNALAAWLRQP